jgi:hypothetical protein
MLFFILKNQQKTTAAALGKTCGCGGFSQTLLPQVHPFL